MISMSPVLAFNNLNGLWLFIVIVVSVIFLNPYCGFPILNKRQLKAELACWNGIVAEIQGTAFQSRPQASNHPPTFLQTASFRNAPTSYPMSMSYVNLRNVLIRVWFLRYASAFLHIRRVDEAGLRDDDKCLSIWHDVFMFCSVCFSIILWLFCLHSCENIVSQVLSISCAYLVALSALNISYGCF